jgi:hypothetical protein
MNLILIKIWQSRKNMLNYSNSHVRIRKVKKTDKYIYITYGNGKTYKYLKPKLKKDIL